MSRIVGLNDLKKKNDDEGKKQEQLFAGGLDQRGGGSGVNVLGPPPSNDNSLFNRIQAEATRSGALTSASTPSGSRRITMYSNGFTVDDGPLRDPQAPENQEFLNDLMKGVVPREFKSSGAVDVDLVDKHTEEYVPPPPPSYVPFSGGSSLGKVEASADAFILDPDVLSTLPDVPDPIDYSKPVTTIQVRTLTGQKLKIRINTDATILQLAVAIKSQYTTEDSYVLTAGFPPVEIKNPDDTIQSANLMNALVTMKKV